MSLFAYWLLMRRWRGRFVFRGKAAYWLLNHIPDALPTTRIWYCTQQLTPPPGVKPELN